MSARNVYWAKIAAGLTDEERAWLKKTRTRQLAGGRYLTNAEIGAKIGKPHHWVSGVCRAIGSRSRVKRARSRVVFNERETGLFKKLWADGVSCAEIGRRWKCSEDWASDRAQRLGLPQRNRAITTKDVADIRRRLAEGQSRYSMVQGGLYSQGTVARYTKDMDNPPPRKKGPPRIIDGGLADRLSRRGMTHRQIAEQLNVSRAGVSKAIKVFQKSMDERASRKPAFLITIRGTA